MEASTQSHTPLYTYLGLIAAIVLLNLLLSNQFVRWDLTEENRYSLTDISKQTVRTIEYPLEVTSYLAGDYPLQIDRFKETLSTLLIELNQYAKGRMNIRFIDPSETPSARDTLQKYGFRPIGINVQTSATEMSQKAMYPIVHLQYGDRILPIDLLSDYQLPNGEPDLVAAEANLEYKLIAGLRRLLQDRRRTMVFLQGQGETPIANIAPDIGQEIINSGYELYTWNMDDPSLSQRPIDNQIDLVIVLQPTEAFTEREKYEIDQYLLRGGKLLWILDYQQVDFDMNRKQNTLTRLWELNLDDLFFQHGFKLNANLVMDLNCQKIELMQETPAGPVFQAEPWVYYPLLRNLPSHPTTRNVDAVLMRYASSIDTLSRAGLQHQLLLTSSPRSRLQANMQYIDLNATLVASQNPELFNQGPFITGLLVEGQFTSNFAGRSAPTDSLRPQVPQLPFVAESNPASRGKMAIIADGEFILGESFREERRYAPMDNRAFILNLLDFMTGDADLAQIRAKEVVVRPLDIDKIRNHASAIKWINLLLPIVLVKLFWIIRIVWRRKRYAA